MEGTGQDRQNELHDIKEDGQCNPLKSGQNHHVLGTLHQIQKSEYNDDHDFQKDNKEIHLNKAEGIWYLNKANPSFKKKHLHKGSKIHTQNEINSNNITTKKRKIV